MNRTIPLAIVAAWLATAHAAVPQTVTFTARIVDDASGKPIAGTHHLAFELFDAPAAGTSVWQEGSDVDVDPTGLVFVELGAIKALDKTVFDGRRLYLQVTYDDTAMDARIALDSVPYSIRAGAANEADSVGGMTAADLQHRITGTCTTNSFITGVNADGTVACAAGNTGTSNITSVVAGTGLEGGGNAGAVTLSLLTSCMPTEILKWNGTAWGCAPDANSGGDITGVFAGSGLMGGGASGDVTLALTNTCGVGQLLKWNGAAWGCANDIDTDTNSGGTITGVSVAATSGLTGGGVAGNVSLTLLTTCAPGQLLKWNGSGWACANDVDTDTNSGGTITGVTAGTGLIGGGTTGTVTLNVAGGAGILVATDSVSLDTAFTDTRYVNAIGDSMSGALDMVGQRVLHRGCPTGYLVAGPGLCIESPDVGGFTFTAAANRCRGAGTHMCSSAEMRSAITAVTLPPGDIFTLDWIDDQVGDAQALFVSTPSNPTDPDGVQATTVSGWSRCCVNVE